MKKLKNNYFTFLLHLCVRDDLGDSRYCKKEKDQTRGGDFPEMVGRLRQKSSDLGDRA